MPLARAARRPRSLPLALLVSGLVAVLMTTAPPPVAQAATVPAGFADSTYVSGLVAPTAMEFAPDGRLFVTQQGGQLRVIENGALLAAPFVSVAVNSTGERGLLGIAFDPNFASNQYVYVYYTTTAGDAHNRVSRFTANGNVAVSGSELILVELDGHSASNHNGGAIHFGLDGRLYIATGDNASGSNSQTLANRHGKLLRINPDGSIPTDNPFYGSATGVNRSIWALGLRNPFTFSVQPGTGRIFINDVGQVSWEEINDGVAGANYGWPSAEGVAGTPPAVAVGTYRDPVHAYSHAQGCAITGGAFYNPSVVQFPSSYVGQYFFADYCNDWIRYLDPATGTVTGFLSGANGPVDLKVGPDGSLFYLNINNGTIGRVQNTASTPPTITDHPDSQLKAVGQSVTFSMSASGTPPLSYQWQRNGVNITGATASSYTIASVTLADNGATFRAVVTNPFGSATSNSATLTVTTSSPPTASITQPAAGTLYSAGQTVNYAGTGSDPEDGNLPAAAFTWEIVFHHDTHTHPFIQPFSGVTAGSFVIPDLGETAANVWYRIHLTVTDSVGLSHSTSRDIFPRVVNLTFVTVPAALQVSLDGQPFATPLTVQSVVGMRRDIGAPTQPGGISGYVFGSWSHGGAESQQIVTPSVSTTYTATFLDAVLFDEKAGQNQPLNGQYPAGVIDWGTGQFLHSAPWGAFVTKNMGFANAGISSGTFSFVSPRRLVSVRAYNGGTVSSNLSFSCPGQVTKQQTVAVGEVTTIAMGWAAACSPVTMSSSNGWNTNFDDFALDGGGPAPTATPAATHTPTPTPTPTRTPTPPPTATPTSTPLPPVYGVSWTADNTPASMSTNALQSVSLSFTNSGSLTWQAGGANPVRVAYHWRSGACPGGATAVWDGLRTPLSADVAPAGSVSGLASSVRAPGSAGTYCLQWDLVREGVTWFSSQGASVLSKTVSVSVPVYGVSWTADGTPAAMAADESRLVSLSFTNEGSLVWAAGGANPVHVAYHWRSGACPGSALVTWDGLRTLLPADVPSGGSVSGLASSLRAPATPGTYCLQWDLVRENVTWFSAQGAATLSRTVSVTTPAYAVSWTADDTPAAMAASATVSVNLSLTNAGSLTWPSAGANPVRVAYHWRSGACPGGAPVTWDGLRTPLPADVPSGGSVSGLVSTVRAPVAPGTYCLVWDLVHEGMTWFSSQGAATLTRTVTVS